MPKQNVRYFDDEIFKRIFFWMKFLYILIDIHSNGSNWQVIIGLDNYLEPKKVLRSDITWDNDYQSTVKFLI